MSLLLILSLANICFAEDEDFSEFRNAIFKGKISPAENNFNDSPPCGVLSAEEQRVKYRTKPGRANNKFKVRDRTRQAPLKRFKKCLIDFGDQFCTKNITREDNSIVTYSLSFSSSSKKRVTATYQYVLQEFSDEEGSFVESCRDVLSGKVKRRSLE